MDIVAIVVIVALFAAFRSSSKDGSKPAGGGGRKWGEASPPEGFDPSTNSLWISPDCDAVVEGKHFFPDAWATMNTRAEEASTLEATLQLGDDNTAMGYIDHLVGMGIEDPDRISEMILREAGPMCAAVDESQWGEPLRQWYAHLRKRVSDYVTQETIG